jgi:hypothetical protein
MSSGARRAVRRFVMLTDTRDWLAARRYSMAERKPQNVYRKRSEGFLRDPVMVSCQIVQ